MEETFDLEKIWQEYGMKEWENTINSLFPGSHYKLEDIFVKVISGDIFGAIKDGLGGITEVIFGDIISQKNTFVFLLILCLGAVLITTLMKAFAEQEVAQFGFYFTYLCTTAILFRCFNSVINIAQTGLENIVRAFVPAYFLSIGISAGAITAKCGYEIVLFTIYLVEHMLLLFILPLIKVYVLLSLLNGLWPEEKLKYLIAGVEKLVVALQKLCFSVVAGLSALQSMVTPSLDTANKGMVKKIVASIPGVGDVTDNVVDIVLASSLAIKNSLGFLLLMFLLLVTVLPLIKVVVTYVWLELTASLLSIVGDKRIVNCIRQVGTGSNLLFRTIGLSAFLFMISIAVLAFTTNRGF